MSDEQWKALKFKITLAVILVVIGGPVIVAGPALPKVLEYTREHKNEAWAPKWYYNIASLMEITFRREQAVKVYEEFYTLYRGDELMKEEQFYAALGDTPKSEVAWGDACASYIPWLAIEWQGRWDERPPALSPTPHPLLGKVLLKYAKYYEDDRQYDQSRHIYAIVNHMWPEGSEEQQTAAKARLRDAGRSM